MRQVRIIFPNYSYIGFPYFILQNCQCALNSFMNIDVLKRSLIHI